MTTEKEIGDYRHAWIRAGDQALHAVEAGTEMGDSIVFIHGFPDFWFGWRHQITGLRENHHVIAYDQRGYNLSSKPTRTCDYDIDLLASDLADVVRSKGSGHVTVVGHDWGGAVAWEFARRYPNLLSRLVIINCPPVHVLFSEQLRNPRQLRSSYYVYLFQVPWFGELVLGRNNASAIGKLLSRMIPTITPAEIETYRRGLGSPGTLHAAINYYRCAFRQALPRMLRGEWRDYHVDVPVLVVWGIRDQALDVALTRHFAPICPAGFTIKYIDAGHFVHQERPTIVNRILLTFVDEKERKEQDFTRSTRIRRL
ncbi:MAG: alpha/beta fold hydrolase [Candidatus Sigynarchaeota archaeon]